MELRSESQARKSWRLGLFAALTLSVLVGAGRTQPAHAAATITVDCTTSPGALASALAAANDGDTLSIQGTCKGTFEIAHSLTLSGNAGATLDGQGAGTVLTVDAGNTVSVDNLTITGGHTDTTNNTAGGIENSGALTLTNSTVYGNTATVPQFRNGVGGILNQGGSLTLVSSTVRANSASATAPFDTAVGGIMNVCCGSSVTLTNSTVSGNSGSSPSDAFGGILNSTPGSIVAVTNSTVSGNSASAPGGPSAFSAAVGGISNSGGTLTLTSGTISGNSVSEPNGGFTPPVAGVSNFFGGTLTIANSLIALQTGGPNCYGPTSDAGYNLDDGTSCGFSGANHSLSSTDPLLDPAGLKDNGGPTQTIALLPGSPAIDAISSGANGCGTTITTDQRGVSRPQGSGCDIGAFELAGDTTPPVITVPAPVTANATSPSGAVVTYSASATDPDDDVASLSCAPASGSTFPIGTTTVTCTASDTHGNTSSARFTVHVKGAGEQLADLSGAVANVGPGTSLADNVSQAQTYLSANDVADACSSLNALIKEVKAQSGITVPPSQATTLIGTAQRIEAVLGC
jgi:hypothetical protein